jgi:anti-sigma B factor antagonist
MSDTESYPTEIVKEVRRQGDAVVLVLTGEIDIGCAVELRNRFLELLRDKPPVLVVNMSDVTFMDSSGLGTLVEVLKWTRRDGGELKLAGMVQSVRNIFEISRLDSIFSIYDTEQGALSS